MPPALTNPDNELEPNIDRTDTSSDVSCAATAVEAFDDVIASALIPVLTGIELNLSAEEGGAVSSVALSVVAAIVGLVVMV